MTILSSLSILLFALTLGQASEVVGKVETSFDKTANFATLRTYSWMTGYNAERASAHKMIVEACDAEMAKLGFTKLPTGADVTLAYYTVKSSYVDLKALDKMQQSGRGEVADSNAVGRLVLIMRTGDPAKQIWSASTREFIDPDPAKASDTIKTATARLFETYPTRVKR